MAVGFPADTAYVNGDVLSAVDVNDITGTLNLVPDMIANIPHPFLLMGA
jgi:hypothetical protein